MSATRRLAKLEGSLPPREAVLLWLAEVHEHDSFDDYLAWLRDQPASTAPVIVIIERARAAARASHAGELRPLVREAEDRATADAVFLFMLIIQLELDATAMIRTGRLRLVALSWESQARVAEGESDRRGWAAWRRAVHDLASDLARSEAARRLLEDRYLDGREVLSPVRVAAWRELREGVSALVEMLPSLPGGRRRQRPDRGVLRTAEQSAPEAAHTLLERVRAQALALLGDHASASALAERALRGAA